jgi:hypothetical protein
MKDREKHPRYLADAGALFGAAPRLKCQGCARSAYELFYGHCHDCADTRDIPKKTAEPQAFHDALDNGTSTVVEGLPARLHPWWHWRRWFGWALR